MCDPTRSFAQRTRSAIPRPASVRARDADEIVGATFLPRIAFSDFSGGPPAGLFTLSLRDFKNIAAARSVLTLPGCASQSGPDPPRTELILGTWNLELGTRNLELGTRNFEKWPAVCGLIRRAQLLPGSGSGSVTRITPGPLSGCGISMLPRWLSMILRETVRPRPRPTLRVL